MPQTQKDQGRVVRQVPTENHPLAQTLNYLKAQGYYPQYRDYADYRANPGRPEPEDDNQMSEAALIAMARANKITKT